MKYNSGELGPGDWLEFSEHLCVLSSPFQCKLPPSALVSHETSVLELGFFFFKLLCVRERCAVSWHACENQVTTLWG